ncbi:MAG: response regulator [Cyanobacteria bacterium P01_A01_bin.45]
MSQDKEFEIQMQFLEEAADYLNTLEGVLLELNNSDSISLEKINAALRAAHSIKGGAAMMGFRALSDLSHRLEDSFKVLKTKKNSLEIDTELQSLLISGVDWLRQIADLHSEGHAVEEDWLKTFCYPVFEELHQRLGDPAPEDVSTMLSPEEGQNIIPLLFETEVDSSLGRLESLLENGEQNGLKEEVVMMAAELGGLGEMLELPAFTQLCQSITNHLEATPESEVVPVAQVALEAWRRSQALVLTNQIQSIPVDIDLSATATNDLQQSPQVPVEIPVEELQLTESESNKTELISESGLDLNLADIYTEENLDYPQIPLENIPLENIPLENIPLENIPLESLTDEKQINPIDANWSENEIIAADFDTLEATLAEDEVPELDEAEPVSIVSQVAPEIPTTDYKFVEHKAEPSFAGTKSEVSENTVRVPSKQLEQINDLFGELIIQRNGLNLQLERLRKLIRNLNRRVQTLERENQQLRTAYDKISTQADNSFNLSSLGLNKNNTTKDPLSEKLSEESSEYLSEEEFTRGIINKFDSLEMDRYNDLNLLSQEVMETIVQVQEVSTDIELSVEDTDQIARKLNKTSKQLQRKLNQVRMRPLSDIVDRFPRAVRDMCVEHNKNVQLRIEGASTLIERNILESLNEPLMHLLRNAFDHGMEDPDTRRIAGKSEQGTIEIKASHRSNRTVIIMGDDGRGINLDKIRAKALAMGLDESLLSQATEDELLSLIFEPGFSTTESVTSLSGRGVGMDVVRNNLKQIRGEISVNTIPGEGTTFILSVPCTLSVSRVLLVESNRMLLAFPTDVVEEIFLLQEDKISKLDDTETLNWHNKKLNLVRLSQSLDFNCVRYDNPDLETAPAINAASVLIVKTASQELAVQIDRTWGEMEVAVRKVEGNIPLPTGFSNCTILGDGRVVPLMNIGEFFNWLNSSDRPTRNSKLPAAKLKTAFISSDNRKVSEPTRAHKGKILIVDDSINVRRFLALTLEKAGYQVEQAKDGQDGLEKLDTGLQVQAVICDIEMPRVDGYGFLGKVKSINNAKNIPVAMLTSRSSDKHRQLAMQLGAVAYFSKPYNEQDLLKTLEEIIDSAAGVTAR